MATKKKPEKVKASSAKKGKKLEKSGLDELHDIAEEHGGYADPASVRSVSAEAADAGMALVGATASVELDRAAPPPALTLPLVADSATLFIQGAQQLTAQLLGQPECAPLLVRVNEWLEKIAAIKKLITGDEDKVEGLKKLVIDQGQPWGEKGSKQMVLAGAIVKVKAVNFRPMEAPIGIEHLDEKKVEAYFRGVAAEPEKTLPSYMKATVKYSLTDLSPQQQANLQKMLADPGEWGQGLRECLKETKYQMMAPEMENES